MGSVWRGVVCGAGAALLALMATAPASVARTEQRLAVRESAFAVRAGERTIRDRVGVAMVLPGERLPLEVKGAAAERSLRVSAAGGTLERESASRWSWTAPQRPGLYPLSITDEQSGAALRVNAFVLVPFREVKRGRLRGYPIGDYPPKRTRDESFYARPEGFIEVTRANIDAELSPHFRLRQFVCKQESGYPKYVVLRPELVSKLERLLEAVKESGIRATTLQIMSGYRTPRYNRSLGNVPDSAHLFGGAADVYVDENGDGVMDDLNGDRRKNHRDALVLQRIAERLDRSYTDAGLIGGLGLYDATEAHGPFIHVDVRGYRARWAG